MTTDETRREPAEVADEPTGPASAPTHGIDRRTVVAGAFTIGVAGTAGALLARRALSPPLTGPPAAAPPVAPGGPAPGAQVIAAVSDVPRGGGVVLADREVVLTRGADDVLRCFSAICTHQGCLVTDVGARSIDCACHGSRFDPATGEVLAGPATRPLPAVRIAVQGDAVVTA